MHALTMRAKYTIKLPNDSSAKYFECISAPWSEKEKEGGGGGEIAKERGRECIARFCAILLYDSR